MNLNIICHLSNIIHNTGNWNGELYLETFKIKKNCVQFFFSTPNSIQESYLFIIKYVTCGRQEEHVWRVCCAEEDLSNMFWPSKCNQDSFSKEISFVTAIPNHSLHHYWKLSIQKCHALFCLHPSNKVIIVEILLHCNSKLWKGCFPIPFPS